jgi:hypothetical protein
LKLAVPSPTAKELEIARHGVDLAEQAERAVIDSDEANEKAASLLSMIKGAFNKAEEERRALTDPLNAVIKNLNKRYKDTLTGPLATAEAVIKSKITEYLQRKRAEAEAAAAALREKAERARSEGRKEALINQAEAALVAGSERTVRGIYGGTASLRKRWVFDVAELDVVPREFLMVDGDKVRDAIKNGVRDIPGIKIYQEETVAAR